MKIGFIGAGKMASAIIQSLQEHQPMHQLIISGSSLQRSKDISQALGVAYANSHQALLDDVDIVFLGIKPQQFQEVLAPLEFKQAVISMAAGVTLKQLESLIAKKLPLIRIMPNMNATIGLSTTAITKNAQVQADLLAQVTELVNAFGTAHVIAEEQFDTFTALAGSSPAYIYYFAEAMAKAGLKHGLPKLKAQKIVAETMLATAQQLLTTNQHPGQLIDDICSPGGATITGLMELERTGFAHSVSAAIDGTINKAKQSAGNRPIKD
ncbi:pyrroline-5-carboxylate reductase [Streptococcus halichoeri]|uniref:pyrroline-5-carboxylate reductase n=1 Tax=Streptococcus halichoeri TaxID=254785 RepID=UPI00135C65FB|nr:pyrroline-5-carboxylate reductase [Streptococcus halichoeri]